MQLAAVLRRFSLASILATMAALAGVFVASGQGSWTALAPVPAVGVGVEGMQVGQIGNKIIAAFGYDFGDTNTTRIYDIDKDAWSFGAAGPLPVRAEGTAVTHGGSLYAIGGRSFGVLADIDRYTPASDTWVSLADMPTARAGLAAAVVGNAIYVIGGRTATGGPCSQFPPFDTQLATVERYDIDKGTWSTVASLPSPRSDLAAYAHGGKIYVFGGCQAVSLGIDNDGDTLVDEDDFDGLDNDGDTLVDEDPPEPTTVFLSDVDVYNPVTDTWSAAPADLPTARAGMYAVGGKGSRIFVIGGWAGGPPLGVNEVYNVPADSWAADTPMLTPRAEMGVVSHGGRIYTVGGALPAFGASSSANEVFKP